MFLAAATMMPSSGPCEAYNHSVGRERRPPPTNGAVAVHACNERLAPPIAGAGVQAHGHELHPKVVGGERIELPTSSV